MILESFESELLEIYGDNIRTRIIGVVGDRCLIINVGDDKREIAAKISEDGMTVLVRHYDAGGLKCDEYEIANPSHTPVDGLKDLIDQRLSFIL